MKEFVENLIGRLEEHVAYNEKMFEMFPNMGEVEKTIYNTQKNSYEETIRIVNQLAEEYNNGWILVNTQGLDVGIQCAMCTNPMKSDRGCDGGCSVNEEMYKKVLDVIERHTHVAPYQPKGE